MQERDLSQSEGKGDRVMELGYVYPIGTDKLPPTRAFIRNPYFETTTPLLVAGAATMAAGGAYYLLRGGEESLDDLFNRPITRREFLKLICGVSAAAAVAPLIPGVRDDIAGYLRGRDLRAYSLFTNPDLAQGYWLREKVGERVYEMRKKAGDLLRVGFTGEEEVTDFRYGRVGKIYNFKYESEWLDKNPVIPEGSNTSLKLYELTAGVLRPATNEKSAAVSTRSDIIHRQYDSPMVASFNATAPQALGMCESIEVGRLQRDIVTCEAPVVYGSSSLFVPAGLSEDSPLWQHAEDRLTMKNQYFEELDFRPRDDSHNGIGFTGNGEVRLITQSELVRSVDSRELPADLDYMALNQFAFDPREGRGIPESFRWSANIHRNANMLLVTEEGKQMVLSGSLDYFLRNEEYLGVLRQVEQQIGTTFTVAACLDVGLATGFTLRTDEDHVRKPVEPDFHDSDGNMSMGMLHTSAISIIQTGV